MHSADVSTRVSASTRVLFLSAFFDDLDDDDVVVDVIATLLL